MSVSIVIMGVAGCGKSSVGQQVAARLGLPLIEGDDFHSDESRAKMREGTALTDADRHGWLLALAAQLQAHPQGVVLSCSALKRAYRDLLRAASPGLRFVYLHIDIEAAQARVAARAAHFFSASLVQSQFAALEDPRGEPLVLRLSATSPVSDLCQAVSAWLNPEEHS